VPHRKGQCLMSLEGILGASKAFLHCCRMLHDVIFCKKVWGRRLGLRTRFSHVTGTPTTCDLGNSLSHMHTHTYTQNNVIIPRRMEQGEGQEARRAWEGKGRSFCGMGSRARRGFLKRYIIC
jgi:hypothetical protein